MNQLINYLGKTSYPAIVQSVAEKFKNVECSTETGNVLVNEFFVKLQESSTPILDLKEFTTNAEKVAPNDTKLADVIDFARKEVRAGGGDLNFLINLAKEEHFATLSRTGFPSPEQTIKAIESEFNEPASVIEQGIKAGLFDTLKSDLLMEIKSIVSDNKSKNKVVQPKDNLAITNISESFNMITEDIVAYNPIGVRVEDSIQNRILFLTESDVLSYDKKTESFFNLNESELKDLTISDSYKRLMGAINNLAYNPKETVFSLKEAWDFDLSITKDGLVKINDDVIVQKEEVKTLLIESITNYQNKANVEGKTFNKLDYTKDADNFLMLLENHGKLINIDNLSVIRNLTTQKYVVVDKNVGSIPVIVTSTNGGKLFESFNQLTEAIDTLLETDKSKELFTEQFLFESNLINEKNVMIQELKESQSELNKIISDVRKMKKIADVDSPAMEKLNEQEKIATDNLDKNMAKLQQISNVNIYYNPLN